MSKFPLNSNKFERGFFLWKLKSNVAIVCSYNLLFLFVGEYICEHNTIRKVCQEFQKIPAYNFTSNSSSVVVKFFSDSSVNRRGFLLRYRYVSSSTTVFSSKFWFWKWCRTSSNLIFYFIFSIYFCLLYFQTYLHLFTMTLVFLKIHLHVRKLL